MKARSSRNSKDVVRDHKTLRSRMKSGDLTPFVVASRYYTALGSVRALTCEILLRYGEIKQLMSLSIDPSDYCAHDVEKFRLDYHATSFMKKFGGLRDDSAASTAWEKFLASEQQCYVTNQAFNRIAGFPAPPPEAIMQRVIRVIRSVLGPVPSFERLFSLAHHGPGTVAGIKGRTVTQKLMQMSCTTTAFGLCLGTVSCVPDWINNCEVTLIPGNEILMVPKTCLTDRTIAREPTFNVFFQLAVGDFLKQRLLSVAKIDLSDQTRNQRKAREGSLTGRLATIDLASASDTLSYNVIRDCLPWDWFLLLDLLRSKRGTYSAESIKVDYEKFSSMGNGYTFELETLIFYAVAVAACQEKGVSSHDVSVYGDDIIVPCEVAPLVIDLLSQFGFRTNTDKTFFSGPFRESCGADYFDGVNVSPFRLRGWDDIGDFFLFCNRLTALAREQHFGPVGSRLLGLRDWLVARLPETLKFGARESADDRVGLKHYPPRRRIRNWIHWHYGWLARSPDRVESENPCFLLAGLWPKRKKLRSHSSTVDTWALWSSQTIGADTRHSLEVPFKPAGRFAYYPSS